MTALRSAAMAAPGAAATAIDAADVAVLQSTQGTLEIWPGCRHAVTLAEAAVIASPTFQRLRRLRQMGLAFHAWPNAENTRASHSLGVSHWAARHLAALDHCPDATTLAILARARDLLAPLSLDIVLRLYALLHDIDLLPLGHTLRYQSRAFTEGSGRPRLAACIAAIKANAGDSACLHAPSAMQRQRWLAAFNAHLDATESALAGTAPGLARLVNELVNSGLGADLMDFALRDSAAIHRPQSRHDGLVDHLRLVQTPSGVRLALALGASPDAQARVAAADDLYRARFEIFAASVFHPVKLAADAMLDFVVRRLGPERCAALLPQECLLAIGDDELIDILAAADEAAAGTGPNAPNVPIAPIARWLRQGQLHEEVWRSEDLATFRQREDAAEALSLAPAWRTAVEMRLRQRLAWAADGDVITAVCAPTMQVKAADAMLCAGTQAFTLAEAHEHGFEVTAPRVAGQYAGLWSLRVYVAARSRGHRDAVRAAAIELFDSEGRQT